MRWPFNHALVRADLFKWCLKADAIDRRREWGARAFAAETLRRVKHSRYCRPSCAKGFSTAGLPLYGAPTVSASIAVCRPQAELFGDNCDGKFGVPGEEISYFQRLMHAGDNEWE